MDSRVSPGGWEVEHRGTFRCNLSLFLAGKERCLSVKQTVKLVVEGFSACGR